MTDRPFTCSDIGFGAYPSSGPGTSVTISHNWCPWNHWKLASSAHAAIFFIAGPSVRLPGLLGQSSSSKPQILTAVTLVESSRDENAKLSGNACCDTWSDSSPDHGWNLWTPNTDVRGSHWVSSEPLHCRSSQHITKAHFNTCFSWVGGGSTRWKWAARPPSLFLCMQSKNTFQVIFTHSNEVSAMNTWHHLACTCNNDACWQALNFKCAEFWCNSHS